MTWPSVLLPYQIQHPWKQRENPSKRVCSFQREETDTPSLQLHEIASKRIQVFLPKRVE